MDNFPLEDWKYYVIKIIICILQLNYYKVYHKIIILYLNLWSTPWYMLNVVIIMIIVIIIEKENKSGKYIN